LDFEFDLEVAVVAVVAEAAIMVNTVVGKVVSNKMTKSVVVAVQRMWQHPRYPKLVRRTSKFMAHDETNACNIGDEVGFLEPRIRV